MHVHCMYVATRSIECVCVCGGGGGGSWSKGHAKDCFEFEIHDFGLFLVRTLANFFGGAVQFDQGFFWVLKKL